MNNNLISIVVVFNNLEMYKKYFEESLKRQTYFDYEIIAVDNTKSVYSSAVSAYSAGAARARGKYIIFSHQDIIFTGNDSLKEITKYFYLFELGYGVIGYSGAREGINGKVAYITLDQHETNYENCFTVDECFFITTSMIYNKYHFTDIGNTWHLYAVEYCLHIRTDGYKIAVVPMNIKHTSNGTRNSNFFKSMRRIVKLYQNDFKHIYTTCIDINTKQPGADVSLFVKQYMPLCIKKLRRKIRYK